MKRSPVYKRRRGIAIWTNGAGHSITQANKSL